MITKHGYKWIIENIPDAEKCPECNSFLNHYQISNKVGFKTTNKYFLNLECNNCGCVRQFEREEN